MHKWIWLLMAGCAGGQVSESDVRTRAQGLGSGQYLVTDGETSWLVGPGGRLSMDGVVFVEGSEVWLYNEADSMEPNADCSCVMEKLGSMDEIPQECVSQTSKKRGVFTRLSDGATVYPFDISSEEYTDSENGTVLKGKWDERVYLERCTSYYACGAAHPNHVCEAVALNLQTGKVEPSETFDVEYDKVVLGELERKLDSSGFELSAAVVSLRVRANQGEERVEALVSTDACYACSDGEWSAYSVSAEAQTSLSRKLPDVVSEQKGELLMWSSVDGESDAAVRALFAPGH